MLANKASSADDQNSHMANDSEVQKEFKSANFGE